jgi:hypothetical protein
MSELLQRPEPALEWQSMLDGLPWISARHIFRCGTTLVGRLAQGDLEIVREDTGDYNAPFRVAAAACDVGLFQLLMRVNREDDCFTVERCEKAPACSLVRGQDPMHGARCRGEPGVAMRYHMAFRLRPGDRIVAGSGTFTFTADPAPSPEVNAVPPAADANGMVDQGHANGADCEVVAGSVKTGPELAAERQKQAEEQGVVIDVGLSDDNLPAVGAGAKEHQVESLSAACTPGPSDQKRQKLGNGVDHAEDRDHAPVVSSTPPYGPPGAQDLEQDRKEEEEQQPQTPAPLLLLFQSIWDHKLASVFRKPVSEGPTSWLLLFPFCLSNPAARALSYATASAGHKSLRTGL